MEHLLVTLVSLYKLLRDVDPAWVNIFWQRRQHKLVEATHDMDLQKRKTLTM
jgi:hypothetical protein